MLKHKGAITWAVLVVVILESWNWYEQNASASDYVHQEKSGISASISPDKQNSLVAPLKTKILEESDKSRKAVQEKLLEPVQGGIESIRETIDPAVTGAANLYKDAKEAVNAVVPAVEVKSHGACVSWN